MNRKVLQTSWKHWDVFYVITRTYVVKSQQFELIDENILYEGHRPTSSFQKGIMAIGSAITGLYNPLRSDMVAALGETLLSEVPLRRMQLQMLNDKTGCQILKDKPFINSKNLDVSKLMDYPKHTLGFAYANFMNRYNITSDTRDPVHYIDNTELAFIINRYRQIHDFIHVLLGFPITVPGEIIVKWFEMMHFELPMTAVAALFGPLTTTVEEQKEIKRFIPWAIYTGRTAKPLINVYFEKELNTDFEELKVKLNIVNPQSEMTSK